MPCISELTAAFQKGPRPSPSGGGTGSRRPRCQPPAREAWRNRGSTTGCVEGPALSAVRGPPNSRAEGCPTHGRPAVCPGTRDPFGSQGPEVRLNDQLPEVAGGAQGRWPGQRGER